MPLAPGGTSGLGRPALPGYAESRGGLRLPELPGAADLRRSSSDTARMRLWYDGPDQLADRPPLLGRRAGPVRQPDGMWTWDSGTHRASSWTTARSQLRLPIPIDLTPPDLARRLLSAREPGRAGAPSPRGASPAWRPMGCASALRPGVDHRHHRHLGRPETGLPLCVEVTAKGRDGRLSRAGFLDLEQARPDPDLVTLRGAAGPASSDRGGTWTSCRPSSATRGRSSPTPWPACPGGPRRQRPPRSMARATPRSACWPCPRSS